MVTVRILTNRYIRDYYFFVTMIPPLDLPEQWEYIFETYKEVNAAAVKFHAVFHVNIHSNEEVMVWINAFKECAFVELKKPRGGTSAAYINASNYIFKVCQHAHNFSWSKTCDSNLLDKHKCQKCSDCQCLSL